MLYKCEYEIIEFIQNIRKRNINTIIKIIECNRLFGVKVTIPFSNLCSSCTGA